VDLNGKQHIAELIEQMADIPGVEWIRLHYA
jgi:ribosomal protein S12 methylthiotransferase